MRPMIGSRYVMREKAAVRGATVFIFTVGLRTSEVFNLIQP